MVVLPPGVVASPLRARPDACAAHLAAWHSATELADGAAVPYVVLPDCSGGDARATRDRRTAALSHAVVQAVTNPTFAAVAGTDGPHAVAEVLAEGAEVGALCTQALHGSADWAVRPERLGYAVARVWSNAAARAGDNPCVPAPEATSFVRADVALPHRLQARLAGGARTVASVGVRLAPGQTVTLPVQLAAPAGDAQSFEVQVEQVAGHDLILDLSSARGQGGQTLQLQVTMADEPAHDQQVVRVRAVRGTSAFSHYFLVARKEAR